MPAFEGGLHPAARRKNDFTSWEEMRERLLPKGAYHLWEPRVLDDYCRYGLARKPDGRFELACPPEVEASIYMTARSNGGIYQSVRKLAIPVTIVRAMERSPDHPPADFSASPTWPGLVNEFPNAREIHLPDCSHFIPMQKPDEVIRILREEVRAWGSTHSGIEA
jgi:pimeloyl-ACP methyl ester carboxylesterase